MSYIKNLASVIIPYYNRIDSVTNSITSVINQSYRPIEIILVDDHSSSSIDLDSFSNKVADITFRHIRNDKNIGPGGSRRKGREISNGEFIAYLDSDDGWKPDFLKATISRLQENPSLSMVFTNVLIHGVNNSKLRLSLKEGYYSLIDLILGKYYWATGAAVWRCQYSRPEYWILTRDHEDYVHDLSCALINDHVYYISSPLSIVNKNVGHRIKRSNKELISSLFYLNSEFIKNRNKLDNRTISKYIDFILWRLRKRPPSTNLFFKYLILVVNVFRITNPLNTKIKINKIYASLKLILFWIKNMVRFT